MVKGPKFYSVEFYIVRSLAMCRVFTVHWYRKNVINAPPPDQ